MQNCPQGKDTTVNTHAQLSPGKGYNAKYACKIVPSERRERQYACKGRQPLFNWLRNRCPAKVRTLHFDASFFNLFVA